MKSSLFLTIIAQSTYGPLSLVMIIALKGLSSENEEGSKVVSVERCSFKDVLLNLLFHHFSAPKCSKA
jgi:hypothetical protein